MNPMIIALISVMVAVIAFCLTFMAPLDWLLILAVITIMFADTYLFPNETESASFYYTRFIPLGLVAIRSLMALRGTRISDRGLPGMFLKPFGVLLLFVTFTTVYSENPLKNGMRALCMALVLISFGIGIPTCMPDDASFRRGIRTVVMIVGWVILIALVTYPIVDHPVMDLGDYVRVRGPFKNPNTLGLLSMLAFFPLAALWWENRRERLPGILAFAAIMGLVLSGSRGSFLGLLAGLTVVTLFRGFDTKLKGAIVTVIGLGVVSVVVLPEFQGLMRTDSGLRFDLWQRAYELGMQKPIQGSTLGDVDDVFENDKPYLQSIEVYSAGSHNEYLRMFVALGAPGLLLALFGLFSIIFRTAVGIKHGEDQLFQVALLAAVVAGMVNAVFEDWLFAFGGAPSLPFWIFLAVLSIYAHRTMIRRNAIRLRQMPGAVRLTPAYNGAVLSYRGTPRLPAAHGGARQ